LIRENNEEIQKQPIEFIVQYDKHTSYQTGEYGIPLSLENAIPYAPIRHIEIIGLVSYIPRDEEDEKNLQEMILEAYQNGIIKSYERIERNIELKGDESFNL